MNIVIPMAGRGSRFADVGIDTPKPLIDVRGKPMYAWAVDSLPLQLAHRLIFVCLDEQLEQTELMNDIQQRYASQQPVIIGLEAVTAGQTCTVLKAKSWIDNNEPLLIFNADTCCRTSMDTLLKELPDDVAGIISVFQAPGERWSFAQVDHHDRVVATAEKKRISNWASNGLYYFSEGATFVQHAEAMIADCATSNNEYYIIPIYNRMIAGGAKVIIEKANETWPLGTHEDLEYFEQHYSQITTPAAH